MKKRPDRPIGVYAEAKAKRQPGFGSLATVLMPGTACETDRLAPAGGTARTLHAVIKKDAARGDQTVLASVIAASLNDRVQRSAGARRGCSHLRHAGDTTQPEVGRSSRPGSCLRAESFVNCGSGGLSATTRVQRVSLQRRPCSHKGVMFARFVCATSSDPGRPGP